MICRTWRERELSQDLGNWIGCHIAAFEYFHGTTKLVVPDNPRTGVDRACRYEPDLNRRYHEMAQHYGVAVMPARPYKLRDKAKVENAVLLAFSGIPAISKLTWQGHEFLDNIKDPGIWGKTKKRVEGLPSVALKVVAAIAEAEVKKHLGL